MSLSVVGTENRFSNKSKCNISNSAVSVVTPVQAICYSWLAKPGANLVDFQMTIVLARFSIELLAGT